MRGGLSIAGGVSIILLAGLGLSRADEPSYRAAADSFPMIEKTAPTEFLTRASEFLRDHPQSRFAPRVALDLLALASATHDEGRTQKARELLLLDYPTSPQAGFALSFYRQPQEYAEFLVKAFDGRLESIDASFVRRFWSAVERGTGHFNTALLEQPGLALRVVLSTQTHPRHPLRAAAQGVLERNTEEAGKVGRILLGTLAGEPPTGKKAPAGESPARSPAPLPNTMELIRHLDDLPSPSLADLAERFLINSLPKEQREQVRSLEAANQIARGNLSEAAALLGQRSLDEVDADSLYWKALCCARLRDRTEAIVTLERLNDRFPQSRWREMIEPLLEGLKNANAHQEVLERCIPELIAQIKKGQWEMLEMSFIIDNWVTHRPVRVYAAVSIKQNRLEFQIRDQGQMVLAYRSQGEKCDVLVDRGGPIRRLPQPLLTVPVAALKVDSDGHFLFNWNMPFGMPLGTAARANRGLLDSDLLTSPPGIDRSLGVVNRNGWLLQSADEGGKVVRLCWIRPPIDAGPLTRVEITLNNEEKYVSLASDLVQCEQCRHGETGSLHFDPPAWPDLPIEEAAAPDASLFTHGLSAVADLFKAAPSVATKDQGALR